MRSRLPLIVLGAAAIAIVRAQEPATPILSVEQVQALLAAPGGSGAQLVDISLSNAMAGMSGFAVAVYSPGAWIRNLRTSVQNAQRPFDETALGDNDRRDVWRVDAAPNMPKKVANAARGSSVAHVVLHGRDAKTLIQPIREEPFDIPVQDESGTSVTFHGLTAEFTSKAVADLWGPNQDRDFWITVIGATSPQQHDFEIKPKHFPLLK